MKELKKWFLLLATVVALTGLASCDMLDDSSDDSDSNDDGSDSSSLEVIGSWVDSWGYYTIITETNFGSYATDGTTMYYDADIVSYSNDAWNASETGEGDCGYMVIQFSDSTDYTIVRWENLETSDGETTMDYSEGYSFSDGYFSSEDAAISGATDSNGYFTYWSESVTKQ
ncbi:MAG: hypothetical protein PQJ59_05605 [Spirochaetales bacterium]|nr:hypothetical protein [Spirochaetales bacterium]